VKTVSIDASVAAAWLFPTQRTRAADLFLGLRTERRFAAPMVFAWEVGNQIAVRSRGDIGQAEILLADLASLNIEIAPAPDDEVVLGGIGQAIRWNLTLFDSAYLNHALTLGGALASRDRRLIEAARAAGVDVFDLRD
jgi:predicted nucleic acid-binding protein